MEFSTLTLAEPLLRALKEEGNVTATPIQEKKARRGITAALAPAAAGTAGAWASPCMEISPRFTIAILINTIKMTMGSSMAAAIANAVTTGGMFNLLRCLQTNNK